MGDPILGMRSDTMTIKRPQSGLVWFTDGRIKLRRKLEQVNTEYGQGNRPLLTQFTVESPLLLQEREDFFPFEPFYVSFAHLRYAQSY